jgi:glycosyltransferase involved in cell wall biosynthesis
VQPGLRTYPSRPSMKVLIISQIFETHADTGSDRHFYFAKRLVEAGHTVTVITANVDYKNAAPKIANAGIRPVAMKVDGIDVRYVPVFTRFRGSFSRRILFFVSFVLSAIGFSLSEKGVDVIYAISTPLSVGVLGSVLSLIKRRPMVFEVTDVWPDAAIQVGVLRQPLVIRLARFLERMSYAQSAAIIALTRGIRDNIISKQVPADRVFLVPNGVDFGLFSPCSIGDARASGAVRSFDGKFVVMYLGAHGLYNALDTVVGAAALLKHVREILVVLVGNGDEKPRLQRLVDELGLSNVKFLSTVPRSESVRLLAAADVFVLPNRKGRFFEGNLPNKLFDYLASARPIIIAGAGESAEVITEAGAGVAVAAEDPAEVVEAIMAYFLTAPAERETIGQRGRSHAARFYDRATQADILIRVIENVSPIKR